jgi:NAD(P)H-dependent FMN reductase
MKIIGIVGSYRKNGTIDQAVSFVLEASAENSAEVEKIYLTEKYIEFCLNCRTCTQEAGESRGQCVHNDDLEELLCKIDEADGIVLGAPVNFFNVNALTRKFIERLVCYAYWPWGKSAAPKMRTNVREKKAIVITSSAMPAFLGRLATGAVRALKIAVKTVGAKPIGSIFIGLAAVNEKEDLADKYVRKARRAGQLLVSRQRR